MLVFYSPFSVLPLKVEDTGGEHRFYDNKDVSFEIVTPLSWHTGCCHCLPCFLSFSGTDEVNISLLTCDR